ncbi:MAG: spermidine/putrescine ABC transporter substrate-binding protein [Verrucomicrobiota bacterium]
MPSDLKRSGFLFNYKIENPEPMALRIVPPVLKRFPKATLRILAPHNFLPPGVLESFTRKTGVNFEILPYETGVEVLDRINHEEPFDIALCSGFIVEALKKRGNLAEINWRAVPNAKFLAEQFRHLPFDPEDKYSVALTWSAVGIAYNTTVFDTPPDSWKDLFEPSGDIRARVGNRIGLMASPHRLFGAALISTGHSPNATDAKSASDAADYLRRTAQATKFKFLPFDDVFKYLKTEEVVFAMAQSSDVTRIMTTNADVSFVIPKEGSWVGYDCTAILSNSGPAQKEISHEFINYLLHPSVAAELSNFTMKASTETATRPFLSPVLKHGPSQLSPASGWIPLLIDSASAVQNNVFLEISPKSPKP